MPCDVALARPITDDPDMLRSIVEVVKGSVLNLFCRLAPWSVSTS